MVSIQERFLIKSRLSWRAYGTYAEHTKIFFTKTGNENIYYINIFYKTEDQRIIFWYLVGLNLNRHKSYYVHKTQIFLFPVFVKKSLYVWLVFKSGF